MAETRGSETTAAIEKFRALVREEFDKANKQELLDNLAEILPYDYSPRGKLALKDLMDFLEEIFPEKLSEFNFRRSGDEEIVVDAVKSFIEINNIKKFIEIIRSDPSKDGALARQAVGEYISDRMQTRGYLINNEESEKSGANRNDYDTLPISNDSSSQNYNEQTTAKGNMRVPARERPEPLDKVLRDNLTARGSPRIRRPMRSAAELGADPKSEEHRYDVKIGGRVPRELRDQFVECAKSRDQSQSAALVEAITDYLAKYGCDEPT